jgi:hypothetical protein
MILHSVPLVFILVVNVLLHLPNAQFVQIPQIDKVYQDVHVILVITILEVNVYNALILV